MNLEKKSGFLFLLLAVSILRIPAQTTQPDTAVTILEANDIPQWVKDIRRWEIVAFGSIPFTMFTATFAMDMYRWKNANGLDFSEPGRRYAPWPLKSAGAALMESKEQELVFLAAAGLSLTVAFTDLIIVQIKRSKARKRAEAIPVGTAIITRTPLFEETTEEQDDSPDEADPLSSEPVVEN